MKEDRRLAVRLALLAALGAALPAFAVEAVIPRVGLDAGLGSAGAPAALVGATLPGPSAAFSVPALSAEFGLAAANVAQRPLSVADGAVSAPGLLRLPDENIAAFLARSRSTQGPRAVPFESLAASRRDGPTDHLRDLKLTAGLSAALKGFEPAAIQRMSAEKIEGISRAVWDHATAGASAAADAPRAKPERYEKLLLAVKYQLLGKGYFNALKAFEFARGYHTGLRKDGLTPEFQHQLEIVLFLMTLKDVRNEETVLTAALLHDVMEDYDVALEELAAKFGPEAARVAWLLTKTHRGVHKPPQAYFDAIAADPAASLIKGADRINNLQTMVGVFTIPKQKEYAAEAERWILPLLKRARGSFPDQTAAYFNVEHMMKSQLELIHAMHAAIGAR